MARRKARNSGIKLQPVELDLYFNTEGVGTGFIDLGEQLSKINRKFFRQGMQFVVQSIEWISSTTSSCFVYRLPHHWPSVNSWTKTMAHWKKQQDEALEAGGLEDTKARWNDFKIFMNEAHADAGFSANLQAQSSAISPGVAGVFLTKAEAAVISPTVALEWEASEVVVPNDGAAGVTNEYTVHMLGPDAGSSKGMIQAYAESRSRPRQVDPNIVDVPTGGLFGEMFDVGHDSTDVITNAQDHNERLPYLNDDDTIHEFYPGGSANGYALTQQAMLSISATGDRVRGSVGSGFMANCGLLAIGYEGTGTLRITLAPGSYKGVMARPMQDVN